MDRNVLNYFYKFNGIKNQFCKVQFIRLIRNKIIDPNTNIFLSHGFQFFDSQNDCNVMVPCDDSNWNQYLTFYNGFNLNVLSFPFTIKLYHDYFYNIQSIQQFSELFSKIITFRTQTIKRGWAIKYGFPYKDKEYRSLEDLTQKQLITWRDPRQNAKINLDMLVQEDFDIR